MQAFRKSVTYPPTQPQTIQLVGENGSLENSLPYFTLLVLLSLLKLKSQPRPTKFVIHAQLNLLIKVESPDPYSTLPYLE